MQRKIKGHYEEITFCVGFSLDCRIINGADDEKGIDGRGKTGDPE